MEETKESTTTVKEVRGVPFMKGDDPRRNIEGRPKGSEDFKTKWLRFIDKVSKENGLTPEDIDNQLFKVGLARAREGDYQFYKDVHDRIYGKPVQPNEDSITGELNINVINFKS